MQSDSISKLERSGNSEQCAVQIHINGLTSVRDPPSLYFHEHVKWYARAATRIGFLFVHIVNLRLRRPTNKSALYAAQPERQTLTMALVHRTVNPANTKNE